MADTAILEKIRKLHVLAERSGTEAEAALAASHVQRLLIKHNLELGEVLFKDDAGGELLVERAWGRIPAFVTDLAGACDELFDVLHYYQTRRVYYRRRDHRFVFIGLKSNIEAASITFEYLLASIDALVDGARSAGIIYGSAECQAFRLGAAARIRSIVKEQKQQTTAANPAHLSLVKFGSAVARKIEAGIKFTGFRGGSQGYMSYGTDAYYAGHNAAAKIDVAGARISRMLKQSH